MRYSVITSIIIGCFFGIVMVVRKYETIHSLPELMGALVGACGMGTLIALIVVLPLTLLSRWETLKRGREPD